MQGVERPADLPRESDGLARVEGALVRDARGERLPVGHVHGQELAPVDLAGVDDADQMRMLDRGRRSRLVQEALAVLVVGRELGLDDLQRDVVDGSLAARPVDGAHRPLAEQALDPVDAEDVARLQLGFRGSLGHRVRIAATPARNGTAPTLQGSGAVVSRGAVPLASARPLRRSRSDMSTTNTQATVLDAFGVELLAAIHPIREMVQYPAEHRIFEHGSAADAFYIIDEGEVRIEVPSKDVDTDPVLEILVAGRLPRRGGSARRVAALGERRREHRRLAREGRGRRPAEPVQGASRGGGRRPALDGPLHGQAPALRLDAGGRDAR